MARSGDHPYCYPGTMIYRNLLGIRDASRLEAADRALSAVKMDALPNGFPLTTEAYRNVHRFVFEDVYEWAGRYRRVDTGRLEEDGGNSPFCRADYIERELEKRFSSIRITIVPGMTLDELVSIAANHVNEVNAIHPFLDGNGRVQRALLKSMGATAGFEIDLAAIVPDDWNAAARIGFRTSDLEPVRRIIRKTIVGPTGRPLGHARSDEDQTLRLLLSEAEMKNIVAIGSNEKQQASTAYGGSFEVAAANIGSIRVPVHETVNGRSKHVGELAGCDGLLAILGRFGTAPFRSVRVTAQASTSRASIELALGETKAREQEFRRHRRSGDLDRQAKSPGRGRGPSTPGGG